MSRLPAKSTEPISAPSVQERNGAQNRATASVTTAMQKGDRREMAQSAAPAVKLLRFPAVRDRTGLSRTTIWRLERCGAFPRHRRISSNAVAWVEEEIVIWIRSKVDDVIT